MKIEDQPDHLFKDTGADLFSARGKEYLEYVDRYLGYICLEEFPSKPSAKAAKVFFLFRDTNYVLEEEYKLYDINAIIAAVGGSLGLFLGFSCRGFLMSLIQRLFVQPETNEVGVG
eukprot:maker-scaffold149_size310270-snap-gene-2.22 protein:Tk01274 transcript:maker-scaffold149_size310270-snap-gene-2.22-mRNA-1 annotation:"pickpocket protein 28-like"